MTGLGRVGTLAVPPGSDRGRGPLRAGGGTARSPSLIKLCPQGARGGADLRPGAKPTPWAPGRGATMPPPAHDAPPAHEGLPPASPTRVAYSAGAPLCGVCALFGILEGASAPPCLYGLLARQGDDRRRSGGELRPWVLARPGLGPPGPGRPAGPAAGWGNAALTGLRNDVNGGVPCWWVARSILSSRRSILSPLTEDVNEGVPCHGVV